MSVWRQFAEQTSALGRCVHAMCRMKDYLLISETHKQELDDAFSELKAAECNLTNVLHGIARDHEERNKAQETGSATHLS